MQIRPSIRMDALPASLPFEARFRMARAAGYEGVEIDVADGPAADLRAAADRAGLTIHSVQCLDNYRFPLASPDPAIRDRGVAAALAQLEAARIVGADTILLVPGVVDRDTSYADLWERSQDVIRRELLPVAERTGIVIAIENVWNGFLLSPFDCARYIEGFGSPFVRLYLDVGNIIFGRPEGWIEITAPYIAKLHLKDLLHWRQHGCRVARIGEGQIDWPRVRAALDGADYSGWAVLAEAELAQPGPARIAFAAARALASKFGSNPVSRLIETRLSRRLIADALRRFRYHVMPLSSG